MKKRYGEFEQVNGAGANRLMDENERMRAGFAAICDGLERGDIGEDVTWFSDFQTLWEFCSTFIGRDEPLGVDLAAPTKADREYMQLCKDAERYRWLRERDLDTIHNGGVFAGLTPENMVVNLEHLDAAIDGAMASDNRTNEEGE